MHRRVRLGGVGRARELHQPVDFHHPQPPGQQFGGRQIGHPQHHQGVADVAEDLAGAVAAQAGGQVRQGLGVEREPQARAAPLVERLDDFRAAHQLGDLIQVEAGLGQRFRHRQVLARPVLVELAGVGDQIRQHPLADRRGHLGIGQGVEAAVDHRPLADCSRPVQNRARVVQIAVIGIDQLPHPTGEQLLQQRLDGDRNLVEEGLFVLEGPAQPVGHRVVQGVVFVKLHQPHRARVAALEVVRRRRARTRVVQRQPRPPVRRPRAVEPTLEIAHQQRLDVGHVLQRLAVVRPFAQCVQRAGDHVGEQPGKLAEGLGVAVRRQLIGDPGGHLGDARKAADRVVAGGVVGIAEMKEIKRPARAGRFRVQAPEQVRIALGVQADHRLAPADVLGDRQLRRPGLANPGGADVEHVPLPFGPGQHDARLALQQPDPVQRGQTAGRDCRRAPRPPPRFDVATVGRAGGIPQPLGVPRRPAEPPPEKQARRVGVQRAGGDAVGPVAAQATLVAHHPPALREPHQRQPAQDRRRAPGRRTGQQQQVRRPQRDGRQAGRRQAARPLDRRPQQRLKRIVRHLSAPAPPAPRFALIEGALFLPAAVFLLPKALFFSTTVFLVPKALFFPTTVFLVPKALFFPATLFLLQKTPAFPVQCGLAVLKGHVGPQQLKKLDMMNCMC